MINRVEKYLPNICVAALTFLGFYLSLGCILNHFYRDGGYILDSAWFAHLISSGDLFLKNPNSLGHLGSEASYYLTHFSPGLAAYSYFSPFKQLSTSYQLGIFLGLITSSSIPLVYTILIGALKPKSTPEKLLLSIYSFLFSIFGITRLLTLDYPHFEAIIPILLAISLYFYCQKKISYFIIFAILACSFREDAGIHGFLIYSSIGLNSLFFPKYRNNYTYKYAFVAALFLASISSFGVIFQLIISNISNTSDSAFQRIYAGDPFFSHLSIDHIIERIISLSSNFQISMPFYILLVLTIACKNNYFIIGYISCIPWAIMGIVAYSDVAGNFSLYYGFPFLLAIIAPFAIINSQVDTVKIDKYSKKFTFIAILFSAPFIIMTSNFKLSNGLPPNHNFMNRIDEGIRVISENADFFRENKILLTTDIASLKPNSFKWFDLAFHQEKLIKETPPGNNLEQAPLGVIYFSGGFEEILANKIIDFYSMRTKNVTLRYEKIYVSIPKRLIEDKDISKNFNKLFKTLSTKTKV